MNKLAEVSLKNGHRATYNHYHKLIYSLSLILLIYFLTSSAQAKYSGGTGNPNDPYRIATAQDMNSIGLDPNDWDKHFVMVNDVNLADYTGTQFNIIGYYTGNYISPENKPFTGVFDGNRHTISNFTYEYDPPTWSHGVGIFCYVDGPDAEIKNLGIIDPCVVGGEYLESVSALVGVIGEGRISNCYVKGGKIIGDEYIAGLAGANHGVISNSYVQDANVAGEGIVGAIAGMNANGLIHKCWANGFIQGNCRIGGLVGVNKGFIQNSYTICDVNCESIGGGLVGENARSISHCYATGQVDGVDDTGAFAGINAAIYEYDKCFWNSDINPTLPGLGQGTDPNVIGLMMSQMQKKSTFTEVSWDFVEIWNIGENQTYPYLRVYPAGDLNHDGIVNFPDFAIFADHWLAGVE